MNGYLVDSNVLLGIATMDPVWFPWSAAQLNSASKEFGGLHVNPIIYAELAPAFETADELDQWLSKEIFKRAPLPFDAAWSAAQAFLKYKRGGGARSAPLPDFYIGAHAEIEDLVLITRDASRYRTYFPSLGLISPE